jgi:hypothetical protein
MPAQDFLGERFRSGNRKWARALQKHVARLALVVLLAMKTDAC